MYKSIIYYFLIKKLVFIILVYVSIFCKMSYTFFLFTKTIMKPNIFEIVTTFFIDFIILFGRGTFPRKMVYLVLLIRYLFFNVYENFYFLRKTFWDTLGINRL